MGLYVVVVSSENNSNKNSSSNISSQDSNIKYRATSTIAVSRPPRFFDHNNNDNESNQIILSHLKSEFKLHKRINNNINNFLFKSSSLLVTQDFNESLSSEDQDLTLHGNSESIENTETLELAQHTQDEEENDEIFELKCNSFHNQYDEEEDDVIPFDACEYEKIEIFTPDFCGHSSHSLISAYSTLLNIYKKQKSKSLSCLNDHHVLSYFRLSNRYLAKTMSNVNLNLVEEEPHNQSQYHHHHHKQYEQPEKIVSLMKTSKTESEIFTLNQNLNETDSPNELAHQGQISNEESVESENLAVKKQKRHQHRKHRSRYNYSRIGTNDLSYYYSLTDVKYYNINDDDEEYLEGSNLTSYDKNTSTNNILSNQSLNKSKSNKTNSLNSLESISSNSGKNNKSRSSTSISSNASSLSSTPASSSTDEDDEAYDANQTSTLSLKSDTVLKQKKKNKYEVIDCKLQKSITLPNANEISSYCLGLGINMRPTKSDTDENEIREDSYNKEKEEDNETTGELEPEISFNTYNNSNESSSINNTSLSNNSSSPSPSFFHNNDTFNTTSASRGCDAQRYNFNLLMQRRQQQEQRKKRFFYLNKPLRNSISNNSNRQKNYENNVFAQYWQDQDNISQKVTTPKCNMCHDLRQQQKNMRIKRKLFNENGDDADLSEYYYEDNDEVDTSKSLNDNDSTYDNNNDNDYEYDYDNYQHEFKYNSNLRATSNQSSKIFKLPSSSSAYDTCSNVSNEMSGKSSSDGSSSSKSSASSNYGIVSQSQSQSVSPATIYDETNKDDKIITGIDKSLNITSVNVNGDIVLPIDETSTINTDVSDPHWDGFTSSPYYNNTLTTEKATLAINEIIQPILPWDELFFELEPIEDLSIKENTNQSLRASNSFRKIRSSTTSTISNATTTTPATFGKRCSSNSTESHPSNRHYSSHHHHHHHHYNHHFHQQQPKIITNLNETIRINQNSTTNSSPRSDTSGSKKEDKKLHSLLKFYKKLDKKLKKTKLLFAEFDSIMTDLNKILNDSHFQFQQASSSLDRYHEKFGSYEVRDQSGTLLNSSYNDVLATCHTNISCLSSIKASIIKNRDQNTDKYDGQQLKKFDFYLFKLDEILNKWKMLETIDERREVSEFDLNLVNLLDELMPLRNAIDYISSLCKEKNFDSIESLESRLNELEDKSLSLSEILNSIKEHKRIYNGFLENAIDLTRDESLVIKLKNEINSIEDFHKSTSVDLKIRIKQLESLQNVWLQLERCLNELDLKFSKLSDSMNNNYSANFRQSYLNYFTDETKLVEQLNDIKSSINEFKASLDSFKDQMMQQNSLQITYNSTLSPSPFDQYSVHGSYLLKLDKFIHKYNNLVDSINQASTNLNKFTSTTNLISNKTHHINHQQFQSKRNNNNLLTSIHLDDLNQNPDSHDIDYLDENNFQMTSTPRYHVTNSSSLLSSSGNFKNILNSGSAVTTVSTSSGTTSIVNKFNLSTKNNRKTYADKSISTIDDKFTQTEVETCNENKKNQDQQHTLSTHRSLDSGIMNVTIGSDVGSISSPSPLSKSFNINTNKLTRNNELHSKSLPQVSKLNRKFDKGISFESINDTESLIKKRDSSKKEECVNLKSKREEIELIKKDDVESKDDIEFKKLVKKHTSAPITTKNSNVECSKKKVSSSFSFTKFLCYSLFFLMFLCLIVINFLPLVMPSCCDYRREFLIFNQKKQDDDQYLPF